MNFRHICDHCGHVMTAYTLPMNEGLIRAFLIFADARVRLGRPLKKGEIGLDNSQYSNFQNLRHFGLIAQPEKGRVWEMTQTGWDFLRGGVIYTPAAHMGGQTLSPFHQAWATHTEPQRKLISLRDVLPEDYKQRAEYQVEKTGS